MSGGYKITTGRYRFDEYGPMCVVSGSMGKETVHYTAPPAAVLDAEMDRFFSWFNESASACGGYPVKSAVAHLYFVSIHPFDDGNGRLARILADMILSQREGDCLFSMSARLQKNRNAYYAELEKAQHGDLNITGWITWYLTCMTTAKWAQVCTCSQDTASRDINQLIKAGVPEKEAAGGRSTSYEIVGKVK
jgi:Fic family protein